MRTSNLPYIKIFVIVGFVAVKYDVGLSLGTNHSKYGNTSDFLLLMDNSGFNGVTQVKQETVVCTYDIP